MVKAFLYHFSRVTIKILKCIMPLMNRATITPEFSTKHVIINEKMDNIFKTSYSIDM